MQGNKYDYDCPVCGERFDDKVRVSGDRQFLSFAVCVMNAEDSDDPLVFIHE